MSQVTTIVKRLEERISDIRAELTNLLSIGPLTVEQQNRVSVLFAGYVAAANGKLGFSNADEKLSPVSKVPYTVVDLSESPFIDLDDVKTASFSMKYARLPPIPEAAKAASAEYSRAG